MLASHLNPSLLRKKNRPNINKTKNIKTIKKPIAHALVKDKTQAKSKPTKNTFAYFNCMKACCQKGISPKKISQVSHECKTNALSINAKMSAAKAQAAKKIKAGYEELG